MKELDFLYVLVVFTLALTCVHGLKCKDREGNDVEWWIMRKLPNSFEYYYLDSNLDVRNEAVNKPSRSTSGKAYHDDSPLARTINQLLTQQYVAGDPMWIMYNEGQNGAGGTGPDPTDPNKIIKIPGYDLFGNRYTHAAAPHAHAKGIVAYNYPLPHTDGFHIMHSVPSFPRAHLQAAYEFVRPSNNEDWMMGKKYGQHYFCYSFATANVNVQDLINILTKEYAHFYRTNADLNNVPVELQNAIDSNWATARAAHRNCYLNKAAGNAQCYNKSWRPIIGNLQFEYIAQFPYDKDHKLDIWTQTIREKLTATWNFTPSRNGREARIGSPVPLMVYARPDEGLAKACRAEMCSGAGYCQGPPLSCECEPGFHGERCEFSCDGSTVISQLPQYLALRQQSTANLYASPVCARPAVPAAAFSISQWVIAKSIIVSTCAYDGGSAASNSSYSLFATQGPFCNITSLCAVNTNRACANGGAGSWILTSGHDVHANVFIEIYQQNPGTVAFLDCREARCSGHGTCNQDGLTCVCDVGYTGHDCSSCADISQPVPVALAVTSANYTSYIDESLCTWTDIKEGFTFQIQGTGQPIVISTCGIDGGSAVQVNDALKITVQSECTSTSFCPYSLISTYFYDELCEDGGVRFLFQSEAAQIYSVVVHGGDNTLLSSNFTVVAKDGCRYYQCSGNGECNGGACTCDEGWYGADCADDSRPYDGYGGPVYFNSPDCSGIPVWYQYNYYEDISTCNSVSACTPLNGLYHKRVCDHSLNIGEFAAYSYYHDNTCTGTPYDIDLYHPGSCVRLSDTTSRKFLCEGERYYTASATCDGNYSFWPTRPNCSSTANIAFTCPPPPVILQVVPSSISSSGEALSMIGENLIQNEGSSVVIIDTWGERHDCQLETWVTPMYLFCIVPPNLGNNITILITCNFVPLPPLIFDPILDSLSKRDLPILIPPINPNNNAKRKINPPFISTISPNMARQGYTMTLSIAFDLGNADRSYFILNSNLRANITRATDEALDFVVPAGLSAGRVTVDLMQRGHLTKQVAVFTLLA